MRVREPPDERGWLYIRRLLDRLGSGLRRRAAAAAALWAGAAALAAMAGLVAAVAALDLPPSACLAGLAAGTAAVVLAAGLAWRRRPADAYLARLIETHRPELKNALVTLVELAGDPASDPSMRSALARRAARIVSRHPSHAFLPAVSWRRPGWTFALSAAALGLVLWLAQGTVIAPWLTGARAGPRGGRGTGVDESPSAGGSVAEARAAAMAADESASVAAALEADAPRFRRLADALGHASNAPDGAATGSRPTADAPDGGTPRGEGTGSRATGGEQPPIPNSGTTPRPRPGGSHKAGADDPSATDGSAAPPPPQEAPVEAPHGGNGSGHPAGEGPEAEHPRGHPEDTHAPDGTGGGPSTGAGGPGPEPTRPPHARPPAPPLPQHRPGTEAPENVLDAMRRAKRLIEKADRALRDPETAKPFLDRMGVSNADMHRFVSAWRRRLKTVEAGPERTRRPGRVRTAPGTDEGEILEPSGHADARAAVVRPKAGTGRRGRLVHAAEASVSPRLRPAVRAYFEHIGRLDEPAGDSGKDRPR